MDKSDERLLGSLETAVKALTEQLKGLNKRLDDKEHKSPCIPLVKLTTRINTAWVAILLVAALSGYLLNVVLSMAGR